MMNNTETMLYKVFDETLKRHARVNFMMISTKLGVDMDTVVNTYKIWAQYNLVH